MNKFTIQCDIDSNGFVFRLIRHRLVGSDIPLPISEWAEHTPKEQLAGTGQLLAWVDEDEAIIAGDTVVVPHAKMAILDNLTATALGAPPTVPYLLDLQHTGTMDQPGFRFRLTWLHMNGQPVPGLKRTGAALQIGSRTYRIPDPLFSIIEAAEAFNSHAPDDMDKRFQAWAKMRELLPEDTGKSIQIDGYLGSTRVAHAACFSLSLHSGIDGFNFDPVLFGPDLAHPVDAEDGALPHEVDQLLPPAQQEIFAKQRFPESKNCKARYALGSGWYVVIDEPVRKALEVVRHAQCSDPETRKGFTKNPRAFLTKALVDAIPEEMIEIIFTETAEYSDRVRDVGIWQPKVLPWVKKNKETWLPETFGIRVGSENIEIKADQVSRLQKVVHEAISNGRPIVSWHGKEIPATSETLSALNSLIGELKPEKATEPSATDNDKEADDKTASPKDSGQYVLEIEENLTGIDYQRFRVRRPATLSPNIPSALKTTLKSYQKEGVELLQEAWNSGYSGILLADDMGLGKTLQALTFIAWLREGMEAKRIRHCPIMIVAPTGLLKNWEEEHNKHMYPPGLGVVLRVFGKELSQLRLQKGQEIDLGLATLDSERLAKADWILTTYETLRNYQHSFGTIRFGAVVFDEMQKIKVPGTVMTHAAKAINSDFTLGLTGTPIENRLADLWCLMDTLQPGLLSDLANFSRKYEKDENPDDLKALKTTLTEQTEHGPQIMIRRMKADRLEGLPEKIEHPLKYIMPTPQAEAYDEIIRVARTSGSSGHMLKTLHRLRSLSLHPYHPSMAKDDKYIDQSARFKAAIEVLDEIAAKKEKALIFLESQEMQPYLACFLQRRYHLKKQPMLINGSVTGPKRQDRVNTFQAGKKGFDVIILSPRAGGVGLTLTAANHVIHLSRWWNPAVEDQCTDRVYRIGQPREVHVYYPMAIHPDYPDHSFDSRLHSLLERKRQLSREMLMPPTSPEDTKYLFEQTVGSGDIKSIDLDTIDSMEPIEFENWVLAKLKDAGHRVNKTPKSHDCGADGIVYHRISGNPYIIQCKHTQSTTSPDSAIEDLLRAKECYALNNPSLIAITNAISFGKSASSKAGHSGIRLVCRDDLATLRYILD